MAFLFAYDRKGPSEDDFNNVSRVPSRQPSTRATAGAADDFRPIPEKLDRGEELGSPAPNKKHIVFPDPVAYK
jgi:hypothetical protein